jgi:hypothetical protein
LIHPQWRPEIHVRPGCYPVRLLTAVRRKAEILAEKGQHVVLESIRDRAGVRAGVDFKTVCDAVVIEDRVQLGGIESQSILIADVHSDGAVLLQIADILIYKGQR